MTHHTPIQTEYSGHLFRSRLEARWAVFFDHLGLKWEYEPQGYEVGPDHDRRRYLPDFRLPDLGVWVEVKGDRAAADRTLLCYAVHPWTGLPGVGTDYPQLLLLGNVPRVDIGWQALHQAAVPIFRDMGGQCPLAEVGFGGYWPGSESSEMGVGNVSVQFHAATLKAWSPDWWCADFDRTTGAVTQMDHSPSWWQFDATVYPEAVLGPGATRELSAAYRAARSARFEHGESGGVL